MEAFDVLEGGSRHGTNTVTIFVNIDANVNYHDYHNMPVVRASTDEANAASMRVLEKLGFACMRRITVGGLDTAFYERPQSAA